VNVGLYSPGSLRLGENRGQAPANPDEFYVHKAYALRRSPCVPAFATWAARRSRLVYGEVASAGRSGFKNGGRRQGKSARASPRSDERSHQSLSRQALINRETLRSPMDIEWPRIGDDNQLYIVSPSRDSQRPQIKRQRYGTLPRLMLQEKGEILGRRAVPLARRIEGRAGTHSFTTFSENGQGSNLAMYCLEHDRSDLGKPVMKRASAIVTTAAAALGHAGDHCPRAGHSSGVGTATTTSGPKKKKPFFL